MPKKKCVWTHTNTENPDDYYGSHDEFWKNCNLDMWYKSGRVEDFEFCPYCGKPITQVTQVSKID